MSEDAPPPEPPPEPPVVVDEPLLPATTSDAELRSAALAMPDTDKDKAKERERDEREAKRRALREKDKKRASGHEEEDDDEHDKKPRSRRLIVLWVAAAAIALLVGIFIFLGSLNTDRYALVCEPEQVLAKQGRSFPPWGLKSIGGEEWKPIAIPANAECKARETEDLAELAGWYLDMLVDQASTALTSRDTTRVEIAAQQLDQALLLARSPDKRDQRKEIERLLGDVEYWRASAKLKDAQQALIDASKQFDEAATKRPRHVTDASAWGAFVKKVADELKAGPAGQPVLTNMGVGAQPIGDGRAQVPTGTALPVEPPPPIDKGSAAPPTQPEGVLL